MGTGNEVGHRSGPSQPVPGGRLRLSGKSADTTPKVTGAFKESSFVELVLLL
jgi:hypothetical protein